MKVTIRTNKGSTYLEVDRSFQLLVDDEMLLEHNGPIPSEVKSESKGCCGGCYGSCHGTSSLYERSEAKVGDEVNYIHFPVPNSSFIEIIRWWSYDEALGENALEIHFKNGTYACYADVPLFIVNEWIEEIKNGGSAGKYYNLNIKNEFESIMES